MKKNNRHFYNKRFIGIVSAILLGMGTALMAQPAPIPPGPGVPPPGSPVIPQNQLPLNPPIQTPPGPPAQTPPPPGWGGPGFLNNPPSDQWMNEGTINVMATGYDTESVLVQIPLVVSYSFNGVTYDVTVDNSWNPLTQSWNIGVDQPAFSTSYYFNGFTYNYYTNLPTGTFYFNL